MKFAEELGVVFCQPWIFFPHWGQSLSLINHPLDIIKKQNKKQTIALNSSPLWIKKVFDVRQVSQRDGVYVGERKMERGVHVCVCVIFLCFDLSLAIICLCLWSSAQLSWLPMKQGDGQTVGFLLSVLMCPLQVSAVTTLFRLCKQETTKEGGRWQ